VGAVAVEAKEAEAPQRMASGNIMADEEENCCVDGQGEAVHAIMGALQEREGKLYRQQGYLSNAVELPESMRGGTLSEDLV
jgi:hypothetical protein